MSEHAILASSSAARWVICPGSVMLEQQYPETEPTEKSLGGTAAHWVASETLNGVVSLPSTAPNGVEIDDEMWEAVDVYVEDVRSVGTGELAIEKRVSMPQIHPENWGTPDAVHFADGVLTIWDFKYGHRHVEVFENWQLIDYAAGCINEYPGVHTVRLRVVQPRNYHKDGPVREWVVKVADLAVYFAVLRCSAAEAFDTETVKCFPSSECLHCNAAHACDTLKASSFSVLDGSGRPMKTDLPDDALGFELRLLDRGIERLQARRLGLAEQAASRVKGGNTVPGYGMEASSGRVRWAKPVNEIIALGEMMNIQIAKPGLITPTQAVKAGLPAELLAAYSERPAGSPKLVQVNVDDARKVFRK